MTCSRIVVFFLVGAFGIFGSLPAQAQQHRATRLGHPATRFAPPLSKPEQLRALFRDEKLRADVAAILQQAGWSGNVDDLRAAAATASISEIKLPKGTIMPFMSSRHDGQPVALMEVLWAGEEPISAYAFEFTSKGRRYRCITPKPCSNFYVTDLGPLPPKLALTMSAPAEASVCEPFEMKIRVRNSGEVPLTSVKVPLALPNGLASADNQTPSNLEVPKLNPGETREFALRIRASAAGNYASSARASSAQGAAAEAKAATQVRAPLITLTCEAPDKALARDPVAACVRVRNSGTVTEANAAVFLPIPPGAVVSNIGSGGVASNDRVTWQLRNFAAGASAQLCASFVLREPGQLSFEAEFVGACAGRISTRCATRVAGVPAILLEVIDIDDPIRLGEEVTYVVKVLNQGTATDTNVRMVCKLPESQQFVSGTGTSTVHAEGQTVTMEPLPVLEPKAEASWRVVIKAVQSGDARFAVELTSDQFKEPINEVESTRQF